MTRMLGSAVLTTVTMACVLGAASRFPDPARDIPAAAGERTAVFAGGCFWGVEGVFERLKGVSNVVSGFAGGSKATAHYELVSTGTTGHAESVQITYDARTITYGQLLKVFFAIAHDPTELNRQGPDEGPQYRSAVFYGTPEEQAVTEAYIRQLSDAKVFRRAIVTRVVPLEGFYAAEAYHQHFLDRNPTHPYIVYNDLSKIDALRRTFPELVNDRYGAGARR
jgi:peptide-methionine (S)-S-oxide reductase